MPIIYIPINLHIQIQKNVFVNQCVLLVFVLGNYTGLLIVDDVLIVES